MDRRKIVIPLMLFLALVLVAPAAAQAEEPVVATLSVPEGQYTVGDPIELTLTVSHPAGYRVIMPDLPAEWGDFVVNGQAPPVTVDQGNGMEMTSQVIDVRLFTPGTFNTPPLTITVTDGAGQVSEITAQSAPVNIASVLIEGDTELRDIKPQFELPYVNLLPWIAVGVIAALVAALIYLIVRRRRARLALAAIDNRLPHEVALDELDRIEGLALPDAGRFKQHYSLVSDCMRTYMEKRFEVPMMERTTAEIQAGLNQVDLGPGIAGHYLSLLDISDLVKFSRYKPEAASAYGLITSARQIVQATLPEETEESIDDENKAAKKPDVPVGPQVSANGGYQRTEVRA